METQVFQFSSIVFKFVESTNSKQSRVQSTSFILFHAKIIFDIFEKLSDHSILWVSLCFSSFNDKTIVEFEDRTFKRVTPKESMTVKIVKVKSSDSSSHESVWKYGTLKTEDQFFLWFRILLNFQCIWWTLLENLCANYFDNWNCNHSVIEKLLLFVCLFFESKWMLPISAKTKRKSLRTNTMGKLYKKMFQIVSKWTNFMMNSSISAVTLSLNFNKLYYKSEWDSL